MFFRYVIVCLVVLVVTLASSSGFASPLPRMRPYTGIGLVVLSWTDSAISQGIPLYADPGLLRVANLNRAGLTGNDWIFGGTETASPLIVSARKGDWLRIYYDDAGREAWLNARYDGNFQSWEQFLKLRMGHMLPGLQSHYYRLLEQPGGRFLMTLGPKRMFKIIKLEDRWSMVLTDQEQIGWLRWRDDDGRLLVGVEQ